MLFIERILKMLKFYVSSCLDCKSREAEANGGGVEEAGRPFWVNCEWFRLYESKGGGDEGHKRLESRSYLYYLLCLSVFPLTSIYCLHCTVDSYHTILYRCVFYNILLHRNICGGRNMDGLSKAFRNQVLWLEQSNGSE